MLVGIRRGVLAGVALGASLLGAASPALAEPYWAAEVEPYGLRVGLVEGTERESLFTIQGAYGWRAGAFATYFGAGVGFFTLRLRAGLAYTPGELRDPGLMARLEVRPQIVQIQCLELGALGHAAVGYRWPLEYRRQNEDVGPAFYLLPAIDAGPDLAREFCSDHRRDSGPVTPDVLLGGSLTLGIDW